MSAQLSEVDERTDQDPCGTYAGYQRHKKAGDTSCEPCRTAAADYMRHYRARHPEKVQSAYAVSAARERAMIRLSKMYPGVFRRLLDEERGR